MIWDSNWLDIHGIWEHFDEPPSAVGEQMPARPKATAPNCGL